MKSIKCFAIEDHGVLHSSDGLFIGRQKFLYSETVAGKTTKKAAAMLHQQIVEGGFDAAILEKPLKAIPELEIEDYKFHFITVRWS